MSTGAKTETKDRGDRAIDWLRGRLSKLYGTKAYADLTIIIRIRDGEIQVAEVDERQTIK